MAFITQAQRTKLIELYVGYFNRAPEQAGLSYWGNDLLTRLGQGKTEAQAFKEIADEFYKAGEQFGIFSAADPVDVFITKIYQNVLGRNQVDQAGMDYWKGKLNSGEVSRGQFVNQLIQEAKAYVAAAPANDPYKWVGTYLENRVAVADWFANNSANLTGQAAIQQGTAIIANSVTPTSAQNGQTAQQAVAAAQQASQSIAGQTFMLTAGADPIVGTAGNDVINALTVKADGAAATTLSAFDAIDGGLGNDTLNIYSDGTNNKQLPASATVKNVETINIFNDTAAFTTDGAVVDASKFVGATAINQNGLAANVTNLAATTTAGFKGIAVGTLSVTAADAAASAAVALTNVDDASSLEVKATATGTLNSVTVSGTVVDSATDGVDPIALNVTVGKDVQALTVNTAVGVTLTVNDGAGTKKVSSVDASASAGAISYVAAATVANVKTGAGKDTVTLATALDATTTAASVSTGAGDDTLNVTAGAAAVTGGTTVTVDAGEGKDTINLTISANTVYDVKAGAGDDTVTITGTIKTTDKIDGGDGVDTVSLAGKLTYVADDYIVLNKVLTNFETLKLTGVAVTNLDASKLAASYTTIDLLAGSTVTNVGAQSLVANGGLTATASGTDTSKSPKVYAGTLNITEKASGTITANADTVNLTVDASKGAVAAVLDGFAKTANVTLVQALKADKSAFEGAASFSLTTAAGVDADLTTLTLSGNGTATVTNAAATNLVTVNASALNSVTFDGKIADGLTYSTSNAKAETVTLGGGIDKVTIAAGSTYGAADTITGLNLVLNAGKTALTAESDTLTVTGATSAVKFTTTQTDLDLALKDAAASVAGANVAVFHLGGDTYVYADNAGTGVEDVVDAGDILVKLTGTIDLDALVVALA